MALALYRKYRPRTFSEVIGQEHVTQPLAQALRTGRLHHAYLFSGPRGCGKTSSARILARSLNCGQGPTPDPCGECASCVALARDGMGSIDVIEIDAASHGGVDDARELRERAFFAPVSSRFKVYVIDEAHMVSAAGFNALLKLVEEPPDYVKFVFATTEPEKVLGTIRSRTHHYPFRLIPPGVLRPFLEQMCAQEGMVVEPAVFPLVIRAGAGSVRDTLSVLDQLMAGAGSEGVTYAGAAALLGVTDASLIDEMCDALAASDGAAVFAAIDRVSEAGHDSRRFAADLLDRLRDLIILRQVPDAAAKGLLEYPTDTLERMESQASQWGPGTLSRMADVVHNGLLEMRGATAPRLLLELVCARMLLPSADTSMSALLQRVERMERRLESGISVMQSAPVEPARVPPGVPAPVASVESASVVAPPPVAVSPAVPPVVPPPPVASSPPISVANTGGERSSPVSADAMRIRQVWDEVLSTVSQRRKRIAALLREAVVQDVDGQTLILTFKYPAHAEMLTNDPDVLLDALNHLFGGQWSVRCDSGSQTSSAVSSSSARQMADLSNQSRPAPSDNWPTPVVPGGTGKKPQGFPHHGGQPSPASPVPPVPPAPSAHPAPSAPPSALPSSPVPSSPGPRRENGQSSRGVVPQGVPGPLESQVSSTSSVSATHPGPTITQPPRERVSQQGYGSAVYPGFDPDDGPLDDDAGGTAAASHESGEGQAVRLLTEVFGAKLIDDH